MHEAYRDGWPPGLGAALPSAVRFILGEPNAVAPYTKMVGDLEHRLQRDIARARYRLKGLLGKIKLHPRDGYLEAELAGSCRGLLSLAAEQGARAEINLVAGCSLRHVLCSDVHADHPRRASEAQAPMTPMPVIG